MANANDMAKKGAKAALKAGRKAVMTAASGILKVLLHVLGPILIPVVIIAIIIISMFMSAEKVSAETGTNFSSTVGNTTEERVWWALKDAGFSDIQIAAVMGNIYQESKFDCTLGDESSCIGLCMWNYQYLGKDLDAYAKSKGVTWKDEETQIEFLVGWLADTGPAVEYINRSNGPIEGGSYTYNGVTYNPGAWRNFKETGDKKADIENCTIAFCANYERCGEDEARFDVRVSSAQKNYNNLNGKERPKITGGSEQESTTNGIKGYFKSACSGRTYTEYYQNDGGPWAWEYGCWVCTQATIMSGFGSKYTPNQLPGFHGAAQNSTWQQYGNCKYERVNNVKASDIVKYLKNGEAIHIRVEGRTLVTDNGSHYFGGHSLALLDYKNENGKDKVYLLDPWKGDPTYGWTDVNTLAPCLVWYEHVWQ